MHKTLVVVEPDSPLLECGDPLFVSFDKYLRVFPKLKQPGTRVINLCDIDRYLGRGYYCSLLAEARNHPVIPNVRTINTLKAARDSGEELLLPHSEELLMLAGQRTTPFLFCFGKAEEPELADFSAKLFNQYPVPALQIEVVGEDNFLRPSVTPLPLSALTAEQHALFMTRLEEFVTPRWRLQTPRRQFRWDMAILVNPDEPNPPSDSGAISRFVKAAAKQGIKAEPVVAAQLQNLTHYDALFIRETTAIDHHTYRLSARAENANLVVMDDPVSILRCCNKVFLHDAFSYQKVPSLRTEVVDSDSTEWLDKLESEFGFPMILKMPESSFSKGVFKVKNRQELAQRLRELLNDSALVLVQEYLFTDFDWRIGVLNNRAIYACKYQMARGHWQIYNHGAARNSEGDSQTLPTFEVPRVVLDTALKAAQVVGNGLYGVDLKEKDGKAFVIEVNDNPSIDHGVEDEYLRDELYMQIIAEFKRRLEARGL